MRRWLRWSDGLLLGFVILAVIVIVGARTIDPLDLRISLALQRWTGVDAWMRAASRFGGEPINVVGPIIAICVLAALAWWRDAAVMLASVVGSALLQQGTKLLVGRARPAAPLRIEALTSGSSFPSGHVMEYLALFGFAAVIVRARMKPSVARTSIVAALIALCCVIGPSRVDLGAHWTTDVLGGYLVGLWWLSMCGRAYHGVPWRS